jgi:phosphoserine phosphatase RsbU/P
MDGLADVLVAPLGSSGHSCTMVDTIELDFEDASRKATSDTLGLLAEMGKLFVSTGDLDASLQLAVAHITDYVEAAGGALFMLDEAGETLTCEACYGETDITGMTVGASQGVVGACVQNDVGEIVRDVSKDDRFHKGVDDQTGFTTLSILCAPMSVKDVKIGAIELINKRSNDGFFEEQDLALLSALASSAALAIINARMSEQLVEQERIARELELAAEIQRSLLPEGNEGLPIAGMNIPARTVSGDFFDYFQLTDGRIVFNLGDVSGKGMNAALLMAKTASLFRCLGKTIDHPGRLMARVNEEICETATRGMFVTMVGGIYDPSTGRLRIANAGHEPPLLQDVDGNFHDFPADAPPLGISTMVVPESGYPVEDIDMNGGAFYLFTDGLTEGYVEGDTELGIDGVLAVLNQARSTPVPERIATVIGAIEQTETTVLRDDLTMLGVDDAAALMERARLAEEEEPSAPEDVILATVSVPAAADRLKLVRSIVGDSARLAGVVDAAVHDVVLAVDEACQNVIRYAYEGRDDGVMELVIAHRNDNLIFELADDADTVDPEKVKPRDLDDVRPGGLGTHLIGEIMDQVEFLPRTAEGGNILRMTKKIS